MQRHPCLEAVCLVTVPDIRSKMGLSVESASMLLQSVPPSVTWLHCATLQDADLRHLERFQSLKLLNLAGSNLITDAGLQHIGQLHSLTNLDLAGSKLITDVGKANYSSNRIQLGLPQVSF